MSPIKVLLVEDSPIALTILQKILATSSEITVVGTASNGIEALDLIPKLEPNVICTDLQMAKMDGLEFTKQVMAKYPKPILIISNSVQQSDTENIFELLQAGAVDVFPKPVGGQATEYEQVKQTLLNKIKILSGVSVFTKPLKDQRHSSRTNNPGLIEATVQITSSAKISSRVQLITIGASTGGPQALAKLLKPLPSDFPVPIICTQHISEGFLSGLVSWLGRECKLAVKIAERGEIPIPGTVYFAPEKHHLEIDTQGKFIYLDHPPVDGHRPSVTVTFKAVARHYSRGAVGILLTGMGKDGAEGTKAIADVGGLTIVQDESTCVVFGMPKEAIALGAAQHILPLSEITPFLLKKIF
ncbi:response regulator receiver modulated CheB methylesterase [Stanieria cyanosphaera PCC 7437]|uniref:Protein-glutamate methylesterase/protein-glutamine glutaminase n=1 Tax=Stanieria cyanosphaera (strain ATCC 29371 / PCC 7437) TaxID=111780 RepID=K9XQ25_STAC7|nr:chemotaxis-specific protein-glutamate methyltransferase CheB [Stanieria cyanosphaera]AFZ34613.1 response regulator receiver modulated CheB methylesterase [Stanieria cyanosphaera PCC 7437]